jgi:hypothetical protein
MGGAARARVLERYSAGNFATAGRTILSRIAG